MDYFSIFMYLVVYTIVWSFTIYFYTRRHIRNIERNVALNQPINYREIVGKKTKIFIQVLSYPPIYCVIIPISVIIMIVMFLWLKHVRINVRHSLTMYTVNELKNVKFFRFLEYAGEDTKEIIRLFSNENSQNSQVNIDFCLKNMADKSETNMIEIVDTTFKQPSVNEDNFLDFIDTFVNHVRPVKLEKILRNISNDYGQSVIQMYQYEFPLYNFVLGVYVNRIRKNKNHLATFPDDLMKMLKKFIVY